MEAELAAVRSAADAARGEADGHAESMADLRARLEAAEAKAALVPERDETMTELRRRLNRAEESASRAPAVAAEAPEKPHPSTAKKQGGTPSWQQGTTKLGTPGADHVDDLKRIHGIGPVMEKTLQSFGIQTWEQLAAFRKADVEKVTKAIDAFPGRIERDEWVRQAKDLVERFPLGTPYDRPTRETFLNESKVD